MDTTLKETLKTHSHIVLKGTHILYFSMVVGLILNRIDFISDDRFSPFLNGFIYIAMFFGALFSLNALSFDNLIRKTLLEYHLGSFLLKMMIILLFLLLSMLSTPSLLYILIILLFYSGSFAFDKIASNTANQYEEATLRRLIKVPEAFISQKNLANIKQILYLSYGFITMFAVYIISLIIFRNNALVPGIIFMLFSGYLLFYHLHLMRLKMVKSIHLIVHAIMQLSITALQYYSFYFLNVRQVFINVVLLILSLHLVLIYTIVIKTRYKNHLLIHTTD